jgi:hypothetical protein
VSEARKRVDASWQGLMEAIDDIPEERMAESGVVGDWSVKDTLAHVAVWDDIIVDLAEQIAAGGTPEREHFEVINQREAAKRAGWDLDKVWNELERSHARLLAALDRFPEYDPEFWASDTYGHYAEHAAQIRHWRADSGIA